MKKYDRKKVLEQVTMLLNYDYSREDNGPWRVKAEFDTEECWRPRYHRDVEKRRRLKFAQILLTKYNSKGEINLSPEEIEKYLIDKQSRVLFPSVLTALSNLEADMQDVRLDNLYLLGYDFSKVKNLKIDLDKVCWKELVCTKFNGASFTGSFDGCRLAEAIFENCTAEQSLDPQNVSGRVLDHAKLGGIEISGSLDYARITGTDFSESKGVIVINPQKIIDLSGISFANCYVFGDLDKKTGQYEEADFSDCDIMGSSFKGIKNTPTIDISKCVWIRNTELAGVRIVGTAKLEDCGRVISDCLIDGKDFELYDKETYPKNGLVQVTIEMPEKKQKKKSIFGWFKK